MGRQAGHRAGHRAGGHGRAIGGAITRAVRRVGGEPRCALRAGIRGKPALWVIVDAPRCYRSSAKPAGKNTGRKPSPSHYGPNFGIGKIGPKAGTWEGWHLVGPRIPSIAAQPTDRPPYAMAIRAGKNVLIEPFLIL